MNYREYESLTAGRDPIQNPAFLKCIKSAKAWRDMATRAYASYSGANRTDAYGYDLAADVFGLLANGADPDAVKQWSDARWAEYAAGMRAKVEAAPKIKSGPMAGQSSISYMQVATESPLAAVFAMVAAWRTECQA